MSLLAFNPRFLVVSLGNPPPLHETLHSAGHLALGAVQQLLHPTQPPFSPSRYGKKASLASIGPKYSLIQSPTLMNVSGPWLAKAWKDVLAGTGLPPDGMSLVLVHDDLEEELGVVKIRQWNRSHRGHNGVKSVAASLRPTDFPGSKRWARISVGIGRPSGRDHATVSDYVLRPLSRYQKSNLQQQAAPALLQRLLELEELWDSQSGKGA